MQMELEKIEVSRVEQHQFQSTWNRCCRARIDLRDCMNYLEAKIRDQTEKLSQYQIQNIVSKVLHFGNFRVFIWSARKKTPKRSIGKLQRPRKARRQRIRTASSEFWAHPSANHRRGE